VLGEEEMDGWTEKHKGFKCSKMLNMENKWLRYGDFR
jgi:hypothetical protein